MNNGKGFSAIPPIVVNLLSDGSSQGGKETEDIKRPRAFREFPDVEVFVD